MARDLSAPLAGLKTIATFGLLICVSVGYTLFTMKDVGLRIRVQRDLRDQFIATCRAQDKPAAQVIREFMRHYVASHDAERPQNADKPKTSPRHRGLGKKEFQKSP